MVKVSMRAALPTILLIMQMLSLPASADNRQNHSMLELRGAFSGCSFCHAVRPLDVEKETYLGPHLIGILGRPSASIPSAFDYSQVDAKC